LPEEFSGHAYRKHIHEFEGTSIRTREQFIDLIESTINNPSDVKNLKRGRTGYWNDEYGFVVISDPNPFIEGTAFRPHEGKHFFDVELR